MSAKTLAEELLAQVQAKNAAYLASLDELDEPVAAPTAPPVQRSVPPIQPATQHDDDDDEAEEPLPEFTVGLPGSIGDLARALEPDFPMNFKVMSAVTKMGLALSGYVRMQGYPHIQPRFYTVLLGEAWYGKTGSIETTLVGDSRYYDTILSIETGPALVTSFTERRKTLELERDSHEPLALLLSCDEIKDVFEKAKASKEARDNLGTKLLRLSDGNKIGNNTVKGGNVQITTAHFAMLGGGTPDGFRGMWTNTGGAKSGLITRIAPIGTNTGKVPRKRRPSDVDAVNAALARIHSQIDAVRATPQVMHVTDEAETLISDWYLTVEGHPHITRVADHIVRYLTVLAVSNDMTLVDTNLMRFGIAFGDHLLAMKMRHNPPDASNTDQAFEQLIVDKYRQWGNMTDRELMIKVRPARHPGGYGSFNRAKHNLTVAEKRVLILGGGKTAIWGIHRG